MNATLRIHRPPSRGGVLATMLLVLCVHAASSSAVTLRAEVGFVGHLVGGRFAPITLTVDGLSAPLDGTLIARQTAGNAWRGTASIEFPVHSGTIRNGILRTTIPIHDDLNPIELLLHDRSGRLIAAATVEIRSRRREQPFPLYVAPARPPAGSVDPVIAPSDLPADWWGFDAVSSLWIAGPLSSAEWQTVTQWALAGGSIVVFTGADFYRIDSPAARRLLSLRQSTLTLWPDGSLALQDGDWADATVLMKRHSEPLLVRRSAGAGSVFIVTVRPSDLTDEERTSLAERLQAANIMRYDGPTADLLAQIPLTGPSHAAVVLIVVCCLSVLGLGSAIGRVRPRGAVGFVVVLSSCCAAAAGFYINCANVNSTVYRMDTIVSVQDGVSIVLFYSALFSTASRLLPASPAVGPRPLLALDPALLSGTYRLEARDGLAALTVDARTTRSLRACGVAADVYRMSVSDTVASIHGPRSERSPVMFVLIDGVAHAVGPWLGAEQVVELRAGVEIEAIELDSAAQAELLRSFAERFPLHAGAWLLVLEEDGRLESFGSATMNVRTIVLTIVRGSGV